MKSLKINGIFLKEERGIKTVNFEEKMNLIAKCAIEKMNKMSGREFDNTLLEDGVRKIKELGILDIYEKEINEFKILIETNKTLSSACDELLKIIEKTTIWNVGKDNEKLTKIKEIIKKYDEFYTSRIYLYKKILELPKIKEMNEDDKIKIAMQLGALDFRELGLEG